ncbi:hypothetical protein IT397_02915 [Candidatus Nomurabacteria bacterium]|nr:hypothetical protein [Candidatus Nomurabacteria bacterium]
MAKNNSIDSRKEGQKAKILDALAKSAIVQLACQQAGIGRATYYRWRNEDQDFAKSCDGAIEEGVSLISDMAESKLIQAIKDQNYSAISFWLRHRHPAYAAKLQIQAKVESLDKPLTPEQEEAIKRAVQLARINNTYEPPTTISTDTKRNEPKNN